MIKIFLLLVCISLTGCSMLMEKPEVAVRSVALAAADRKGVQLDFLLAVANPNPFKLNLNGYSYDLLVSAMPLAKGESRDTVEFAGNAVTDVRLPVKVSFRDLQQIIRKSPDSDHLPYRLKAALNLQTPLGPLAVPLDKEGTFSVPSHIKPSSIMKQINKFLKNE